MTQKPRLPFRPADRDYVLVVARAAGTHTTRSVREQGVTTTSHRVRILEELGHCTTLVLVGPSRDGVMQLRESSLQLSDLQGHRVERLITVGVDAAQRWADMIDADLLEVDSIDDALASLQDSAPVAA